MWLGYQCLKEDKQVLRKNYKDHMTSIALNNYAWHNHDNGI